MDKERREKYQLWFLVFSMVGTLIIVALVVGDIVLDYLSERIVEENIKHVRGFF